jgi:hypothetical protein
VDQEEGFPQTLEDKASGQVEPPVIVAKHTKKRPADGLDRFESRLVTKIPKMPDLIGSLQFLGDSGWKLPVSVGNNGDKHDEFSVYSLPV